MDIYRLYKLIDANKINEFVKDSQEEHLNLEFKTVTKSDFSNRDDRKNFAVALSGFANSSGGLVIWGVEAKKKQQGIDCACGIKEIRPLQLLITKLNEFTGQFVEPIIEGVRHKKIETSGDKGFAISLVPESDTGPHMAKAGVDRYYKRSGGGFYKMEHFDIEDMFGRRKKPKLSLHTNITQVGSESGPRGTFYECGVIISIENFGRGIAKYIGLALAVNPPYTIGQYGIDSYGRYGLLRLPRAGPWQVRFLGDANIVIHSKSLLEITIIKRKIRADCTGIEDLTIEYEINADEMTPVREKKIIKGAEILSKVVSKASEGG
jgi:hypothetical protein